MPNITYFDNAATTFPKPESVYLAMDEFSRTCGVSLGRGQHKLSAKASFTADRTRDAILEMFHAENKKVVFTNTATESLNIILFGITLPENATIYISPFEHNAVTRPLNHLAKSKTIDIQQLCVEKDTYEFDLNSIKQQFEEKVPSCVIVSHVSNVIGNIAPIKEIFSLAKQYGAITIADMSQSAGLIDTDLSSSIYDYAVFAGHKTLYGPLGISGFVSANPFVLPPLIYGGTGIESANQEMPLNSLTRFEAGSHNSTAIAGLSSAIQWIRKLGIDKIYAREQENKNKLITILEEYSNIHWIKTSNQVGVISCIFDGYASDEIGNVLSGNDVACRSGLHCSPYAHKFIGTFPAGTVRFSVSYFNNDDDFERLDDVLKYIHDNS